MIPGETDAQVRQAEHERAVELIDAVAIRNALLGTDTALTALERDTAITICDLDGLSRRIVAEGLGMPKDTLTTTILRRRDQLPYYATRVMAMAAVGPAEDLVDAVGAEDAPAVADILHALNRQGLYALAVVLADLVVKARDPGADDAPAATALDPPATTEAAP